MKFLDYDIKNGTHRTALEEWAPHEPMAPDFFEWNYITAPMIGANGHTYFLFYCFLNFSGEHYSQHIKEGMGGAELPPGKIIHADATHFCDYDTGLFLNNNVVAFMDPEDVFDFDTNTIITDNGKERAEFSYQGEKLTLDAKTNIFDVHLDLTGGDLVNWHEDHLGINGFIQEGAPEDRSFYYSCPRLPFTGTLKYKEKDGTEVMTEVYGMGWIDRQWGNFDSRHWEWTSMRFGNGDRINLYNFASGNQAGTYYHADTKETEYFTSFRVIQNGYTRTQTGIWCSFGWTYDLPVYDGFLTCEPLSDQNTIDSPGNSYFEGLSKLLDDDGNQIGWAVTESMDSKYMENAPYQKNQHNR